MTTLKNIASVLHHQLPERPLAMPRSLTDFKVLTFDCYGTLIDWESGIWDALQPLIASSGRNDIDRQTALATFAQAEHRQQADTPNLTYPELLTSVHRGAAELLNIETSDEMDKTFGTSVPHWPAFPDTADALRVLKQHYKLVILSNVNRAGFAASNKKLGVTFDAIYTAEDIGSYKPDPANFQYMLDHLRSDLGLEREDILHTAQSLFHDHVPASGLNLSKAWIDRQGLSKGGDWGATAHVADRPEFDFIYSTMREMADAVQAAAS